MSPGGQQKTLGCCLFRNLLGTCCVSAPYLMLLRHSLIPKTGKTQPSHSKIECRLIGHRLVNSLWSSLSLELRNTHVLTAHLAQSPLQLGPKQEKQDDHIIWLWVDTISWPADKLIFTILPRKLGRAGKKLSVSPQWCPGTQGMGRVFFSVL